MLGSGPRRVVEAPASHGDGSHLAALLSRVAPGIGICRRHRAAPPRADLRSCGYNSIAAADHRRKLSRIDRSSGGPQDHQRQRPTRIGGYTCGSAKPVVIDMDSTAFDSYLELFRENSTDTALVYNDDRPGSHNARLRFVAMSEGKLRGARARLRGGRRSLSAQSHPAAPHPRCDPDRRWPHPFLTGSGFLRGPSRRPMSARFYSLQRRRRERPEVPHRKSRA